MSEAELHLLAGRLKGAKRAAAERGELRTPLPIGYVYDDDGQVVKDADEEVATAIADVFAAFTPTGSAYQVVACFAERRSPAAPMAGRGPGGWPSAGSPTRGCWASWPTRSMPGPTCSAGSVRGAWSARTGRSAR